MLCSNMIALVAGKGKSVGSFMKVCTASGSVRAKEVENRER